jgi:hypothetical protein
LRRLLRRLPAFVRDARDAGWDVPIANVSFVGSESLLALLIEDGKAKNKEYTHNLINSQVVPSYHLTELPAVRQYRALMDKHNPAPPAGVAEEGYQPLPYSFVSLEGYVNARLLVEVLQRLGPNPRRTRIKETVEAIRDFDLGIGVTASFGANRHQGLDEVYFTVVEDGRFVRLGDWKRWNK